ncbi:MAG TPA: response regulator [Jatrophihabitantaceae bacterium]|nr:response regulator [Jatrophihabitantaceae bacterium]
MDADDDARRDDLRAGPAGKPPGSGSAVRVVLAEDEPTVRETLAALLSLEDDIVVVAQVASGDAVVPAAVEHRADVALLDIGLPGLDGLAAAAELVARRPGCRTLILTGLGTPDHMRRAFAVGVSGFLLKGGPADALIDAVRRVARGERVIDPQLSRAALDAAGEADESG